MTIKELRDQLDSYPEDATVKISSDAEGNDIKDIHQVALESGIDTPTIWPI